MDTGKFIKTNPFSFGFSFKTCKGAKFKKGMILVLLFSRVILQP